MSEQTLKYTEEKTSFLEVHAEQWLNDRNQSEEFAVWENLSRDVIRLFTDIFDLDSELQERYCNGLPFQPKLEDRIRHLVLRWITLADQMIRHGKDFEHKGYLTEGIEDLQNKLKEAKATI